MYKHKNKERSNSSAESSRRNSSSSTGRSSQLSQLTQRSQEGKEPTSVASNSPLKNDDLNVSKLDTGKSVIKNDGEKSQDGAQSATAKFLVGQKTKAEHSPAQKLYVGQSKPTEITREPENNKTPVPNISNENMLLSKAKPKVLNSEASNELQKQPKIETGIPSEKKRAPPTPKRIPLSKSEPLAKSHKTQEPPQVLDQSMKKAADKQVHPPAPPPPPPQQVHPPPPPPPPPPPSLETTTDVAKTKEIKLSKPESKAPKLILEPAELLNARRRLKRIVREDNFNPVTLSRKELFEEEYEKSGETPPEHLPLHIVKPAIVSQNISADLVTLNLSGIDQLTDFLFPLMLGGGVSPTASFHSLRKIFIVGCLNISDQGLKWIASLSPNLQMIEMNACRKITEKGLHNLFIRCKSLQNLAVMAGNVGLIPDSIMVTKVPQGAIQWAGCPIVSEGRQFYMCHTDLEEQQSYFESNKRKLVILRDSSSGEEITPLLTGQRGKKSALFSYSESFVVPGVDSSNASNSFNIFETEANSPLQDSLISQGAIVLIAYTSPSDEDQLISSSDRIADHVSSVIMKCPDVVLLLVDVAGSSNDGKMTDLILNRLQFLVNALYATSYEMYTRTWHLENLDFKAQQGLSWAITALECLDEIAPVEGTSEKMTFLNVTKKNFQKKVIAALSQCAKSVKKCVPWVHCEWSSNIEEIIDKLPKSGAITQSSLFKKTDEEARQLLHERYSYPRLGKVINLMQNWGEALYLWNQHKKLCVTKMEEYKNLLDKLLTNQPPDKVNLSFLGGNISCWKESSVKVLLQAEKVDVKARDVLNILTRQGMLLPVGKRIIEDETVTETVYVRTDDVPNDHDILKTLWPEPCPSQRVLQTNRCYNILPTVPPGFMPKLLRTLLKVYKPLYVWKTGFLIRQGPVDIKASLHRYKKAILDKTPILIVSARVLNFSMDMPFASTSSSKVEARKVMFSSLRQLLTIVDYTCLKLETYALITLPCPECAENSLEGMTSTKKKSHMPYYIALASRHKSCSQHKKINASFLCDLTEENGEVQVVPVHNFPYQMAVANLIEETVKSDRHRPMDPRERCFYCGGSIDIPCLHCTMCSVCTGNFAKMVKALHPGHIKSMSFKLQLIRNGALTDDDRIVSNTKGSCYYYKKGHRMQLLKPMSPFYWDEIYFTVLRGANIHLHFYFGSGKKLEYHGFEGQFIDQNGKAVQNDMWKCRDANFINIKLESVEVGKKVRIVFFLKGLEVYSEEVESWHVQLFVNSQKSGMYIVHTPGLKNGWYEPYDFFKVGSTLEVVEDNNIIHPAVITNRTLEGHLTLEVNGVTQQHIFCSRQLRPTGHTQAIGSALTSQLPDVTESEDGKMNPRQPVPLWSFLKFQVPFGFEEMLKIRIKEENENGSNGQDQDEKTLTHLIMPCTAMDFPSVWYARQVQLRDRVEKILFSDGKWNFSMTPFLLLPKKVTTDDLTVCSQNCLTGNLQLHPFCYYPADVNTVMTSGPTAPRPKTIECFHNVHMLNNQGIELDSLEVEEYGNPGLVLLWAWSLMLLRLQHERLGDFKALISGVPKLEDKTPEQLHKGYMQIIEEVNQALLLTMGKMFDPKSAITDHAIDYWKKLMETHGEEQGLFRVKGAFSDEIMYMCESHQAAWQLNKELQHFSGLPGPYTQFVYSINLADNSLTQLPPEFFTSMPCLKDLSLSKNDLESLPHEIGKCSQLVSLSVDENRLKELPSSLANCQEIIRLYIDKNDFAEFPEVILKLKNLVRLYAQFLHLRSLPENIGDLTQLEVLSFQGNCLTSLPESMGKLQKLKNLSLNGVMWMKSRSNILLSKENFEDFLKSNNLLQWLDRHNQDKSSIFRLFDEDTNGTLDPKEIGKLNATMFHIFPRFGYMGIEPPDDDTESGFPEVLFELRNLEYLSMQYQGLVSIPEKIKNLTKLQTLHLGNNPNLLMISAQVGSVPLKRLNLEACPRLKTPPKEIRAKGFLATFAYLKRLLSGSVTCQRTKLMLVGLGGAGKTSLVRSLLSKNKTTSLTTGEDITDGIDICPWTVETEEGDITYSVWDFAGQTVYYNTHQFFLSDRAVYLLLWNIRLGHEHAGLHFWLSSISVHAPKAPIFIIGTHLDQVSKVELPMREMQKTYPQICGFHFVSSHSGHGIPELQESIIEVTLRQQYMGEKIPGVWLNLEASLKGIQDKSVITYKELESRASRAGIFESTEVAQAVQFLHELGSIQHFTNTNLKSHVVINPQWIVDVMACVVSVKDSPIKDGRLRHSMIAKVWKDYEPDLHNWMLRLTEEFDLTFPLKDEKTNLVPCLLPEKKPEFEWPEQEKNGYNKETKIVYKFDYLPAGLFNRGQVRLHKFSDSALIWKRGSYLKKNSHVCLLHQSQDSELTVKAFGPRPENIVLMVHEVFETLILESFKGITYDFYMPCPDCMKVAVKDPHMFAASIIRRATELKAPFLQCLKYFHTVSITDLHAILPPDSNLDFDLHLVHAVRGMKELQHNLAADVFVCYCKLDAVKSHEESVLPTKVIEDVEALDYKCWTSEDNRSDSTDEMAKALMDAKVFMVFMSNNFVKDENCCNLFKYAKLTLRKPIVIVAIGDNLNWKQSNMGILMADEVYVNMMKASRYDHKLPELETMLRDKHDVKKKKESKKNFPPCFISYSWQNSAQAVAKGSRTSEGAVGYGDPRAIKEFLESKGIKCWIDVERVGVHGLFEDIGQGLIGSQVVVVCMSDQYSASENCAIEFRYAANTLKLPIILAVVGTGNKWRASELGIMSLNYPLVSFQERSNNAMDKLLEEVKKHITGDEIQAQEEKLKSQKEEKNKQTQEQQKLSFQELCELAQRKFLRQVSQYAERLDSVPYPNLMLVDFCDTEKGEIESAKEKQKAESVLESPSTAQSSSPDAGDKKKYKDFHDQKFCVHLLCEHEEGWHASGDPIPLDANFGRIIEQYLPYIARITAIAKYSKKLVLKSMTSEVGYGYLKWLEENPNVTVTTDYQESYGDVRQMVQDADTEMVMGKLQRCLLPSGKNIWLCESHRKAMRVTVLTRESHVTTIHQQSEAMGVDYMLQALEHLDLDYLPQQLKQAQLADNQKSEGKRKKTAKLKDSNVELPEPGRDTASSPSSSALVTDVSNARRESYSNVQASKEEQQSRQQRPTLSRSNTKSRACRLM